MKKIIFAWVAMALLASGCSRYVVYSVSERPARPVPGGVVYALPHTLIKVAVTIDQMDYSSAPYADFASDLLGIQTSTTDTLYTLSSIELSAVNVPDPNGYYFVVPKHTSVSIDGRGFLVAIGGEQTEQPVAGNMLTTTMSMDSVGGKPTLTRAQYNLYDRADTFYTRFDAPGKPSLVMTSKDVRNRRQQAQAAAERLQEIREKKEALLFGEYEGDYSSEAIRYIIEQLETMEQEIVAQFVGQKKSETIVYYIDPKAEKSAIEELTVELLRFDPQRGLLDLEETDGEVISCNIRCENYLHKASRFVRYRTHATGPHNVFNRHSFKYAIPETATVTVFSDQFSFSKQLKVAQYGAVANLPYGSCEARFDPNTGEILYFKR